MKLSRLRDTRSQCLDRLLRSPSHRHCRSRVEISRKEKCETSGRSGVAINRSKYMWKWDTWHAIKGRAREFVQYHRGQWLSIDCIVNCKINLKIPLVILHVDSSFCNLIRGEY